MFTVENDAYREIANSLKSIVLPLNPSSLPLYIVSHREGLRAKVPDTFLSRRIMEAFERLYPKVQLFSGKQPFGLIGMQLEGEILQVAMRRTATRCFALPIHDAIAVPEKVYELAKTGLEDACNT